MYVHQEGDNGEAAKGTRHSDFVVSTSDGGRTWLLIQAYNQGAPRFVTEAAFETAMEEERNTMLSLEVPTPVSMFPRSAALASDLNYLNRDSEGDIQYDEHETIQPNSEQLEPIVTVFETQPGWTMDDSEGFPEDFAALIVISRAIPRPVEVRACVWRSATSLVVPSD